MAHDDKFKDLPIWQNSRKIVRAIYACSDSGAFASDHGLRDQIRRAAVSVMGSIAEGFVPRRNVDTSLQSSPRKTNRDFVKLLSIGKASLAEVRPQLYLALDFSYVSESTHQKLNIDSSKLGAEIGGFMRYLSEHTPPVAAGSTISNPRTAIRGTRA